MTYINSLFKKNIGHKVMFNIIIQLIFLSTLWCVGLYMISREKGDAFYFLNKALENAPPLIYKPIIGCVNCMASLHTLLVMGMYFFIAGYPSITALQYVLIWVLVAIITAGTNGIIYEIYSWFRHYTIALERNNELAEKAETD